MSSATDARICKIEIEIENFMGLAEAHVEIDGEGLVVQGTNGAGKTSHLSALRAAFIGAGFDRRSVLLGADRARLFARVDGIAIRREMSADGKEILDLRDAAGAKIPKPATWLRERFGAVAIDPTALLSMKGPERRDYVLGVLPVATTTQELRGYAPDLPSAFQVMAGEHGLLANTRAHDLMYAERKEANATLKRLAEDERRAHAACEASPTVPGMASAEVARYGLTAAERALSEHEATVRSVEAHTARTASARTRIDQLRADAASMEHGSEEIDAEERELDNAIAVEVKARAEVERLEALLAKAREALADADRTHGARTATCTRLQRDNERAGALRAEADRLAATLDDAAPTPPTTDDVVLQGLVILRRKALDAAVANDRALTLVATHKAAQEAAREAQKRADALDKQVRALADVAPRDLLKRCNGIAGLEVLADDIAIDGVAVGSLCGMEQLKLCVDVAMAASGGSGRVIICDRLEALDDDALVALVEYIRSRKYVLIGTRVASCPLTYLTASEAAEYAKERAEAERAMVAKRSAKALPKAAS